MTTITELLILAWRIISPNALFANQWYCEETWLHIILALFPKITSAGKIDRRALTTALNKIAETFHSGSEASYRS